MKRYVLLLFLLSRPAWAYYPWDMYQAQRQVAGGNWGAAVALYQKALSERPDSPEAHYNLGLCFYRQGKFAEAETEFTKAMTAAPAGELKGQAAYNLGNARFKQKKLEPALEAYKVGLRWAELDEDSRYNAQVVLDMLKKPPPPKEPPPPKDPKQKPPPPKKDDKDKKKPPPDKNDKNNKDKKPPGKDDKDKQPPGKDKKPPGKDGRDKQPPGKDGKDKQPPGKDGKDKQPPGKDGKDKQPPGKDGKDKGQQPPPGQGKGNPSGSPTPPEQGNGGAQPSTPEQKDKEDADRMLQFFQNREKQAQKRRMPVRGSMPSGADDW